MSLDHDRLKRLLETSVYDVRHAVFISSTEESQTPSKDYLNDATNGAFVPNGTGRVEFERLGQTATSVGSTDLVASPYSTRLRPVTDLGYLDTASRIVVVNISFRAYDHRVTGSAEQDAATIAAIDASIATNEALHASRFRGGLVGDWIHNYFRPSFRIAGTNILRDMAQPHVGSRDAYGNLQEFNRADMSVGLPLPWSFDDLYAVIDTRSGAMVSATPEVHAQCAQYVPSTGRYVRYPVRCVAQFVVTQGNRDSCS